MDKKKIAQYIEQEKLFSLKDKVLVTLSGGADSVALLRLLLDMGYTCEAAHCNFHLRGDESDRDEMFVRKLCLQLEIPLHIRHFQTTEEAAKRHISIEMAARELRYAWFEELRLQQGADVIAVAHHKDDSVETLLLNLIRGTGINGLLGIRPKNGKIVRPLLCLDRKEITEYLQGIGQTYVTDSTNLQDEYTRNKIRLNLLPLMQEINPSVKESLLRTAEHLNDAALLYNKGIEEGKQKVQTGQSIRIATLLEEPAPETLLFEILSPLGFNGTQIKDIFTSLSGQPGKIFLSKDWRVVKDRDLLLVTPANFSKAPTASFPDDLSLPFRLIMEEQEVTDNFVIPRDRTIACFDANKLKQPLTVRLCQQGDSFIPFGMTGRKKVSDYLTNRKFSLPRKEQQWVLCSGKHIIWLIGERTDNRFRIDENTRRVLIIKFIP
ncbi:tRNA lysidine(34) synthetase TilS [Bacteroides stercorirosoris]|uniref:tRNA(Ile)-lysidine synthase n=1 Tax=Bacteroides stercorirosoris TaxID=871324 RepID=A0A413H2E6_9BACE|nr:tRNA lysidine(34) synthetase TilS [Bacteroides stercorirosoris]RGX77649.1 tRNA lysidine(34) synthetase TilS [Bacteroides stercorirosoris]